METVSACQVKVRRSPDLVRPVGDGNCHQTLTIIKYWSFRISTDSVSKLLFATLLVVEIKFSEV